MRRLRAIIGRVLGAVKIVVGDGRIPRPLRWGVTLAALPIPGPFDEALLLVVGGVLWIFYREQLSEAWEQADGPACRLREDAAAGQRERPDNLRRSAVSK